MDITKVAQTLAHQYIQTQQAERPVDKKTMAAQFAGSARMANACGFGHTPTHVEMSVIDAHRDTVNALGERPAFYAMGNHGQKAWDKEFIARTEIALAAIL